MLRNSAFCWLLKSKIVPIIAINLCGFSFSRIYLLKTAFLLSVNTVLNRFTTCSI